MIQIANLILQENEILLDETKLGFIRSKLANAGDEYSLGINSNYYKISLRDSKPITKLLIKVILRKDKLSELLELFYNQQSSLLNEFKPGDNIFNNLLYSYFNPSVNPNYKYCFLDNLEIEDSMVYKKNLYYRSSLEIVEI